MEQDAPAISVEADAGGQTEERAAETLKAQGLLAIAGGQTEMMLHPADMTVADEIAQEDPEIFSHPIGYADRSPRPQQARTDLKLLVVVERHRERSGCSHGPAPSVS